MSLAGKLQLALEVPGNLSDDELITEVKQLKAEHAAALAREQRCVQAFMTREQHLLDRLDIVARQLSQISGPQTGS